MSLQGVEILYMGILEVGIKKWIFFFATVHNGKGVYNSLLGEQKVGHRSTVTL